MWLSLSWLRDFVDLGDRSAERIAEDLTLRTALIEGIERRGEIPAEIVVGKVLERRKHPDADRLSVCAVDVGQGQVLEVVCGAPNVRAGLAVAVAMVGAALSGDVKIRRSKIRGVVSNGMLCSERELGLSDEHDGILELGDGLELGSPVRAVPGLSDVLLEIDNKSITHRPDLWGHEGFGRELAAIYDQPFRAAPVATAPNAGTAAVRVEIEAADLCGRYCALPIRGALGGPTPLLMRRRLANCGVRSLGLAVDLSNYVMLELGQPTHPFDLRELRGGVIRVRRASAGERFTTLDGIERQLPVGACMIADGERAVAIGGIMGGANSGIAADTADGVLESASFDAISVRRTSSALGLRTDALARFEKFLDPALAERAVRRFARIAADLRLPLECSAGFANEGTATAPGTVVHLRRDRLDLKLGIRLPEERVEGVLQRLGFRCRAAGDGWSVDVPSFRATRDVRAEDDVIEEVGRIYGYDAIAPALPRVECGPARLEPLSDAWRTCVRVLTERFAFAEVLAYAHVEERVLEQASSAMAVPWIELANPQQQTARRLRRSLVPWLIEFFDRNTRAHEEVRLFECGRIFLPAAPGGVLPQQPWHVAAIWGERVTRKGASGRVLRQLKGAVEALADALPRNLDFGAADGAGESLGHLHPTRAAVLQCGGDRIGSIGQVHPDVADRLGWKGEVAVVEFDLAAAVATAAAGRAYSPPLRFPTVVFDLSFLADYSVPYRAIEGAARSASSLLRSVELVEEYFAPPIPPGSRSLTLRFEFADAEGTLTDERAAAELARVRTAIEAAGAALRA